MKKMMHVGLCEGDIAQTVLLPGSPERSLAIASRLEHVEEKAYHREYRTFTGSLEGMPVSVCSTGMGGPSMSIAVEELYQLGARTMIRVGTCLPVQKHITRGSLIIPNGAVRMEGVADQYLPPEFPAVPDVDLVDLLSQSAEELHHPWEIGTCITRASFYTPFDLTERPLGATLSDIWKSYVKGGALCTDMESAVLFIVAGCLGVRSASLLVSVSDGPASVESLEDAPSDCEDIVITTALHALRRQFL